jgi:hypothetical protein
MSILTHALELIRSYVACRIFGHEWVDTTGFASKIFSPRFREQTCVDCGDIRTQPWVN